MSQGRRRSRESLTRTLHEICARLDQKTIIALTWRERFLPEELSVEFRPAALWVAGSFARGALECGDLDLILGVECLKGQLARGSRIAAAAFGIFPDVRVYAGTPEKNESGIDLKEAALVWQGPSISRRSALTALRRATAASGHASRWVAPGDARQHPSRPAAEFACGRTNPGKRPQQRRARSRLVSRARRPVRP
jgi:hypothetical protein